MNISTSRTRLIVLTAALVMVLIQSGILAWVNIERWDTAYELKDLRQELDGKTALQAKLHVERDNLLSSYVLRKKAKELGLEPAKQGQIRRIK